MDYTLKELQEHPDYLKASTDQQQEMDYQYTEEAWKEASQDIRYAGGDRSTRQRFREAFDTKHPMGSYVRPQEENDEGDFSRDFSNQLSMGTDQTLNALNIGKNSLGIDHPHLEFTPENRNQMAKLIVASEKRRQGEYIPPSLKEIHKDLAALSKQSEHAKTFEDKFSVFLEATATTLKHAVTNPKGSVLLAAESLPNMVAPAIGGVSGGITAGPAGAAGGVFTGSFATEQGAYLREGILKELHDRGLNITEENVHSVMNDSQLMSVLMDKSVKKAAATAGTDTALSVIGGKLGTSSVRNASSSALKRNRLKLKNIAEKTSEKGLTGITEIASEPISEAAGQLAAEGKVDAGELVAETLGGFGTSVVSTPMDISLFGSKTDKIEKKTVPGTITKEHVNSPAQREYKKKVAAAVSFKDVSKISDPQSEVYDPIMAVDVLQKINQDESLTIPEKIQNLDQAQSVYRDLNTKKFKIIEEAKKLNTENATDQDLKQVKTLVEEAKNIDQVINTINPLIKSMRDIDTETDSSTIISEINTALESANDQSIKDSIISAFGSKKGYEISESGILDNIVKNEQINSETRDQANKALEYQKAEKALTDHQIDPDKTTEEVHTDIIHGGPGFNGIKTYEQVIAVALQKNDMDTVKSQFEALKSFAKGHQKKADIFATVYNANLENQPVSASIQAQMRQYDNERIASGKPTGYDLTTKNSENFVNNMLLEADALNKAVDMIESWVLASNKAIPTPTSSTSTETVGSGTTEAVTENGAEAIAKDPDEGHSEGSTRTTESVEVSPEKEIYSKLTNKELEIVKKSVPESSIDRKVIDEIIDERTQKTKPKKEEATPKQFSESHQNIINPVDTDPDNKIKGKFKTKQAKSLLHTQDDIVSVMNPDQMKNTYIFTENHPMDENAEAVIHSIRAFGKQFRKAFKSEFKPKINGRTGKFNTEYRFEDPIQFLLNEDLTVPQKVIDAMMAASYKWLATRSRETLFNKEDQIQKILGVNETTRLNRHAYNLIGDIGVTATMLQESLGKDIIQFLGIKESDTADFNIQNKLELSLGLQAIATLQAMGLLEQTDVLRGAAPGKEKQSVTGFTGLINSLEDAQWEKYTDLEYSFFVPTKRDLQKIKDINVLKKKADILGIQYNNKLSDQKIRYEIISNIHQAWKDKGTLTFYRVATKNGDIKQSIDKRIIDVNNTSKNTMERIFTGENSKTNYSWKKPRSVNKKLKGTKFQASEQQIENLKNHQARSYKVSTRTLGFYLLMGGQHLNTLHGIMDPEKAHIENYKTVEGVNRGAERSYKSVLNWLSDAEKQKNGYQSEFYIPEEFWRQGRMGQTGDINPQGDKIHRFLFNVSSWEKKIDLTDPDIRNAFMEAVALGLDIENSKVGGMKNAITKAQEKLNTPIMRKAIESINNIFDGRGPMNEIVIESESMKQMYAEDMNNIMVGVQEGEAGLHTLKTLIEYARYERALAAGETEFTTDLTTEIDGVSNGPAMARIQLMSDDANMAETLTALQNAGISFSETQMNNGLAKHLNRPLSHDAYQTIGSAWSDTLVRIESDLRFEDRLRFKALENIFGEFRNEKGHINGLVRKLSKGPTMKTIYGMGSKTLLKELNETFISDIYSKMEKAVEKKDIEALRELTRNLKPIINRNFLEKETLNSDGTINNSKVLTTKFTKEDLASIREAVDLFHGQALSDAINIVYGDIQKVFKNFNSGVGLSAVLYNSVLNLKIKQAVKKAASENREITVGELKEIEKSIENLYPHVVTPFGEKMPLAKPNKEKDYSNKKQGIINREVRQSYRNLPGKKAAPYTINGLESPGVAGTILTIHNQDSVVANTLMGNWDILNNHDGFTIGITNAQSMAQSANKIFFETMKTFDMGKELYAAVSSVSKAFVTHQTDLLEAGINQEDINQMIASEIISLTGMRSFKPEGAEKAIKVTASTSVAAMNYILSTMRDTAQQTTKNKKTLTDAMVGVEQYSYPGGHYKTGNQTETIRFGDQKFNPDTITKEAEKRLKDGIKFTNELADSIGKVAVKEAQKDIKIGSSQESSKMSINPDDYKLQREINQMNVLDIYNQIKNNSTISASPGHNQHLQSILKDVVQKVMNPVDLFLKDNPDIEPEGLFVHTGSARDKIFITSQNRIIGPVSGALSQGIRMSTGEVYTHELIHSVIHTGLQNNKRLRAKIEQLFHLAKKELGTDGYKAFLNNSNPNQYEIDAAKTRYDYVFRNTDSIKISEFVDGIDPANGITRIQEYSNYLDEFMALALTNENFGKALSKIKLTDTQYNSRSFKDIKGNNIQETLGNIAQIIMDFLYKKFTTRTTEETMDKELKNLAILLSKKDSDQKSAIYTNLQKIGEQYSKMVSLGNDLTKKVVTGAPVLKTIHTGKKTIDALKDSDTSFGQSLRNMEYAYQRLDQGLIKSTVTEIKGRTDRTGWLHKLLSRRQIFLDAAKQQASDTYVNMVNEATKEPLTDIEKSAITKAGLKTDLANLYFSFGSDTVFNLLKDRKELRKKTSEVLNQIKNDPDLKPFVTYYERAADALGHFMIHSRTRSDEVVFQNAWLIASLKNTREEGSLTEVQINKAEKLIDQLASLRALYYTKHSDRQTLVSLIEKDSEGFGKIIGMHEVLKSDALKNTFIDNKSKFIKGYTKQILNPQISIIQAPLADRITLAKEGYTLSTILPRDPSDATIRPEMYMYVSRTGKVNDFVSTIASYTNNKAKGTNSATILRKAGLSGKAAKQVDTATIQAKSGIIDNMMNPSFVPALGTGNFMVPQVDGNGDIIGYRYMMTEETKDSHMEQITACDKILGSMAGQIIDKVRTPQINRELIQGLNAVYLDGYKHNPQGFLEIGPNSENPKLRDIYYMLPAQTKSDIQTVWGRQSIMVPKDFVDIAFGYRQYSVTDAFTKNPTDRAKLEKMIVYFGNMIFKDQAAQRLTTVENLLTELTRFAKSNIIVKSLHVTLNNLGSNLVYLKSKGVPVSTIMRLGWEAIAMGNKYQIDMKKLDKLQIERKALIKGHYTSNQLKELDAAIIRTKDAIKRNPATKTIQAGLMPSLVDDVETVTSGSNFPSDFEKRITKFTDRLPKSVVNVGKVIALTEDTEAFKVLNNAVKMTDYIGRHVLYTHYTQNGMAHEKAIASVEDEFVNFNIPTHQMIEYGNKIGLLWFTKYALRILKVIKNSIVEKPFDVFMAYMLSVHTGLDNILNSTPTGIDDILNHIGNPIDSAIGSLDEPLIFGRIDDILDTL